jgi:serine/threonine-protein kinase
VRLIDFGIAAPAYNGAHEVFGSPGHMPPEQLRGEDVGPPADVFAVATLLYEAWSARPPFRRRTAEQSENALSEPVAALSTFDPALAPLDALLASAMALDPATRPQSAEELSRPLRRFIADRDLGDLTRKVGERVRELRAMSDPGARPDLPDSPAGVTPVVNETRTFATRSHEALGHEASTTPSLAPPNGVVPYVATRRMNDDAGSWSTAGGRAVARTSVRPVRAPKYRGMAGLALGIVAVAAAAGGAWRYGGTGPGVSTAREETAGATARQENGPIPTKNIATVEPERGGREEVAAPGTGAREDGGQAATGAVAPSELGPRTPPRPGLATGATGARLAASAGAATGASSAAGASPATGASAATADSAVGHLRILANPMANVEIDGKARGPAPIADVALPPGTHFVRLDCAALGEAVAQNVPVSAGESITISGDFTGAHGRILVRRASASP